MLRIGGAMLASWIIVGRFAPTAAFAQTSAAPTTVMRVRDRFIASHRCAIAARLLMIHRRGPRETPKNRFLTASVGGKSQNYVQCIFFENDTKMFCEASSGFYGLRTGDATGLRRSEASMDGLRRLGFTGSGSDGNFHREIDVDMPAEVGKVSDLMLATLYDVYGARLGAVIDITAPKAHVAAQLCAAPEA